MQPKKKCMLRILSDRAVIVPEPPRTQVCQVLCLLQVQIIIKHVSTLAHSQKELGGSSLLTNAGEKAAPFLSLSVSMHAFYFEKEEVLMPSVRHPVGW